MLRQQVKYLAVLLPLISTAYASDMLPARQNKQELDRLERQNNQAIIEEAKRTEKQYQQQRAQRDDEGIFSLPAEAGVKFKIDKIVILDDERFNASPQRQEIIENYQGKELGKAEIFTVIKELTDFYISRGYVTTMVGIEPGSIKEGVLTLRVLWGKINGFEVNNSEPSFRQKTRLFSAFPFAKGKVLNMQDVDQAVENLMRVSGEDNLQIKPSKLDAMSNLNLIVKPSFPVSISAGINNSGSKSEGWQQYYGSTTFKNIAGLNDIFNAYYSWNNLINDDDEKKAWSLSYGVPLGYWTFDLSWYHSSYDQTIDGGYGNYASEGNSDRKSLRISRMLARNATGKTSLWAKMEKRDNYSAFEHEQIDVSSKKYTSVSSGITYVGSLMGGWLYGDLGVMAGVPWFDAAWKDDQDLEGFDLNYIKYNGMVSWTRPLFQFGRLGGSYELNTGFQYSPDVLASDAKATLGDEFTVRGYKDDALQVDSGAWVGNTLNLPFDIHFAGVSQLTPFMGYDFGFAQDNCPEGVNTCDAQFMMGAAVGIKATGSYFSSSLTAGWPVKKPDTMSDQEIDNTVVYYKMDVNF